MRTFTIVGLGFMGASLALRIKDCIPSSRIVGISRSREKALRAKKKGIIQDTGTLPPPDTDILIFATPIRSIPSLLKKLLPHISPSTLITDMGSTKEWIHKEISSFLPPEYTFIGSHPFCGSEKQGMEHANPEIFPGAWCFLTLEKETGKVEYLRKFWEELGMKVKVISPEIHDRILAYTSHLPHVVAVVLINSLPQEYLSLTGTGFQDTTRIAGGGVDIWEDIISTNRENLLSAMEDFRKEWELVEKKISQNDISSILKKAKERRESII